MVKARTKTKIMVSVYPIPNEDFGWSGERFKALFRNTFQGCEYSIWASSMTMCLSNSHRNKFMLPQQRPGTVAHTEPTFQNAFSQHFSRV
jgi:hypothetical protein